MESRMNPGLASDPQDPEAGKESARHRIFRLLEVAGAEDRASRFVDVAILSLIALNTAALVLETVPSVAATWDPFFRRFEWMSVAVFTVEYLLRIWAAPEAPGYESPVGGRVRFGARPLMLIDLLAILPAYLPFLGIDLRFARALRLMRVFRILKVARYSRAIQALGRAFSRSKEELVMTGVAVLIVLVIASSALYFAEREAQPDAFVSIPETMWWGIATLTTVGYGDVYPVTNLGRLLGGIVALVGVCVIAIPTAIIGAGFLEELGSRGRGEGVCPTCGRPAPTDETGSGPGSDAVGPAVDPSGR